MFFSLVFHWFTSQVTSEVRSDVLQYLVFHTANEQKELLEEIDRLRPPTGLTQRARQD
jgi:hypothetical protein